MADGTAGGQTVEIRVEGAAWRVPAGLTLAAALLQGGTRALRTSPRLGAPRGAFCMMGVCQECAVEIDGRIRRACMTPVREGMVVSLKGAGQA